MASGRDERPGHRVAALPIVMPGAASVLESLRIRGGDSGCRVGLVGFALHAASIVRHPGGRIIERLSTSAPLMAPLLFPNLALLALMSLWVLARHPEGLDEGAQPQRSVPPSRLQR